MDINKIDFNKYFQSKTFKRIFCIVGILIIALVIFQAGMFVGFKKARGSYKWAENYERNFGGRFMEHGGKMGGKKGFFPSMPMGAQRGDFQNSHGVVGRVIKVALPTFAVSDRDNIEKVVIIKNDTNIARFHETATSTDLKTNDSVVVIGTSNDNGQIEAKFIRIMPAQK